MFRETLKCAAIATILMVGVTEVVEVINLTTSPVEQDCDRIVWRAYRNGYYTFVPNNRPNMVGPVVFCKRVNETTIMSADEEWLVPGNAQSYARILGEDGRQYVGITYEVILEDNDNNIGCNFDLARKTLVFDEDGFYAEIIAESPYSIIRIGSNNFDYYSGYPGCSGVISRYDRDTGKSTPLFRLAEELDEKKNV